MGPCSHMNSEEMKESTSTFTFSDCNNEHELKDKSNNLQNHFYQSHLDVSLKVIKISKLIYIYR